MGSENWNCYRLVSSCSSSYGLEKFEWPHWARHSSRNYSIAHRLAGTVEGAQMQNHLLASIQLGTFVLSWAKIHDHLQTLAWSCSQVQSCYHDSKTARTLA